MLYEQALDLAIQSFPDDDGPLFPFALIAKNTGDLTHFTIVTSNSHKAMSSGRRIVLEHAAEASQYAIVTDTYIRVDGERFDALFVEYGGHDAGRVIAQRYRRTPGFEKLGEPLDVERRPSALVPLDPFTLSWGSITPDMYNQQQNTAVHAVTHTLQTPEQIDRSGRFLRARARMFTAALPKDATQLVFVDDRGQKLDRTAIINSVSPIPVQFTGDN